MYFTPDMIFMAISIVAGTVVLFNKGLPLYFRLFPVFLLGTFLNELAAGYMVTHDYYTTELYNIYNIFQFGFYLYYLSSIFRLRSAHLISRRILLIFLLLAVLNLLFYQKISVYNSITYALGCLLVVAFSTYYFFELFKRKDIVVLTREPAFWIVTGLLFYYSCTFPLMSSANFVLNTSELVLNSLQSLILLMNVLLYSLFTIAFLCRIRIRKSIS